jgi:glycosyl hydrolase family 42 (putative beta-galactosidase)
MRRSRMCCIVAMIQALVFCTAVQAFEALEHQTDYSYLGKLKDGTIRILVFANYAAQRDSIELAQRLDAEITIAGLGCSTYPNDFERKTFYWPDFRVRVPEMTTDVLQALSKDYDVIIMDTAPPWSAYPEPVQQRILGKIKNGTALLRFSGKDDKFLTALKQQDITFKPSQWNLHNYEKIQEQPVFSENYYLMGKTPIAVLSDQMTFHQQGYLITKSYSQLAYEYKMRRVANIIYKLSRNIQDSSISAISIKSGRACILEISENNTADTLRYRLVNEAFETIAVENIGIAKDTGSLDIKLPNVSNGFYAVLAELYQDDKLIDWTDVLFEVIYNQGISSAGLDKLVYAVGESINLNLNYTGKNKSTLHININDAYGRLVYERTFPDAPKQFKIPVPDNSLSVFNTITLALVQSKHVLDKHTINFSISENQPQDDFPVLLWRFGDDDIRGHNYLQLLQDEGVTGSVNCDVDSETALSLARYNMVAIPYTTWMHGILLSEELYSQDWLAKTEERCRTTARYYSPYTVAAYTLGDENYLNPFKPEGRFSGEPQVMKKFQQYLKQDYAGIDDLNIQWGTSHACFDEILLNSEEELFDSYKNPSAWVDYRMFTTREFMGMHNHFQEIIREIDPDAIVGFDGAEQFSSYDGFDWYQFCEKLGLNNTYNEYLLKAGMTNKMFNGLCVRSFTDKSNYRGTFINNIDPTWGVSYGPWYMALCQLNSIWWWTGSFYGLEVEAYDIHHQPSAVFGKIMETVREIRNGHAELLMNAEADFSPVAIHYSENNWHASTISSGIGNHVNNLGVTDENWFKIPLFGDNPEMEKVFGTVDSAGHYAASVENFITLFNDLGYQPQMVARQQIEAGDLLRKGFKVLVLPFVESLSTAEVDEIIAFTEAGGVVIADYRTAIRDKHGKILDESPLDELFGIERSSFELKKAPMRLLIDSPANGFIKGSFDALFTNKSVKLTTGIASGYNQYNSPVFIANRYKRGWGLFFNADIYDYMSCRKQGLEQTYKEVLQKLLVHFIDMRPKYQVLSNKGPAPHTEVFSFTDNGIDLIGVARDYSVFNHEPFNIKIPLNKKAHTYNVRKKEYLGFTDSVSTVMESGEVLLIAQCPYRIRSVEIKAKLSIKAGQKLNLMIQVQANNSDTLANHVVTIKVFDPKNNEKSILGQNLYVEKGQGSFVIPVALNDQKGTWTIAVEECISGLSTTHTFMVR